jgi:hypothetical protein
LIADGPATCRRIFEYLGLPDVADAVTKFAEVDLHGRLGDYTGTKKYNQLSSEPIDKWKRTLCNPLRLYWVRRYINWMGPERLATMGYSQEQLLAELDGISTSGKDLFPDLARTVIGAFYQIFEPQIMKDKMRMLEQWHKIHIHR